LPPTTEMLCEEQLTHVHLYDAVPSIVLKEGAFCKPEQNESPC